MAILIFSVYLGWLPTSGLFNPSWKNYVLPSITLGWSPSAGILRLVRSSMLDTLDSEYVKFARAKGVSKQKVILKHALRNAAIVPMTYAGILLAAFITGTVVVENVFSWPGLGRLSLEAVRNQDFPMLSALVLLGTGTFFIVNLIIDVLYRLIDPRIRIN
jgi:peptide/nickel transport system permease protein